MASAEEVKKMGAKLDELILSHSKSSPDNTPKMSKERNNVADQAPKEGSILLTEGKIAPAGQRNQKLKKRKKKKDDKKEGSDSDDFGDVSSDESVDGKKNANEKSQEGGNKDTQAAAAAAAEGVNSRSPKPKMSFRGDWAGDIPDEVRNSVPKGVDVTALSAEQLAKVLAKTVNLDGSSEDSSSLDGSDSDA